MSFRWTGDMPPKMARVAADTPKKVGRALFQELQVELKEVKRSTPVDLGALVNSEHVEGPVYHGATISGHIVAGGPAAPYAIYVHEDLQAFHRVGGPKYIERPMRESAPYLAGRIARRLKL